jgi:ParB/RepB/Spo0J family partition protein
MHLLRGVDPFKIQVPKVRVTSTWDDDDYKEFQASIEADGIQDPIKCVKDGEDLWLIDGLHRIEEAKLKGLKLDVVYREGTVTDAMLRNLYINRMRGGTKASEEAKLVTHLLNEVKIPYAEILKRTGLSQEKLDQLLTIGSADPLILRALDAEEIKIGHAFNLARLPTPAQQIRLFQALRQMIPFPTVQYVKEVVDQSLEIMAQRKENPERREPTFAVPTVKCALCEQDWPVPKMVGITVCRTCAGVAEDYIREMKKKRGATKTDTEILADKIAAAETT